MKRLVAAALAAATVGGGTLIATPAFASLNPTLTVAPSTAYNGDSVAITAKCKNLHSFVTVSSPALGFSEKGEKGEELKVLLELRWDVKPGVFAITGECTRPTGDPGGTNTADLTVKHKETPKPPPPPKPINGFTQDVTVKTGFGGMARFVANHHPAA
jgi:hypothetical protein